LDALSNGEFVCNFKQFIMQKVQFFTGNSKFVNLKLKKTAFPVRIFEIISPPFERATNFWFRNKI
jgi:hypothetical protein